MCESKRKPVYARNKRIRHFMPPVMVDYIAANFGNGGWPVRTWGRVFIMDTILSHYQFTPGEIDGRVQLVIWPRMKSFSDDDYRRMAPTGKYELIEA